MGLHLCLCSSHLVISLSKACDLTCMQYSGYWPHSREIIRLVVSGHPSPLSHQNCLSVRPWNTSPKTFTITSPMSVTLSVTKGCLNSLRISSRPFFNLNYIGGTKQTLRILVVSTNFRFTVIEVPATKTHQSGGYGISLSIAWSGCHKFFAKVSMYCEQGVKSQAGHSYFKMVTPIVSGSIVFFYWVLLSTAVY